MAAVTVTGTKTKTERKPEPHRNPTQNGMKIISKLMAGTLLLAMYFNPVTGQAQSPTVVGQWDFNAGNLNSSIGADPLNYIDGPGGATEQGTSFGTTTALGVPNIDGAVANIMKFPANTSPQGYLIFFLAAPNGGGGLVKQYTLIFD